MKRKIFSFLLIIITLFTTIRVNASESSLVDANYKNEIVNLPQKDYYELFQIQEPEEKKIKKDDLEENYNTYHYVAIGNSLTKHELTGYWWNECGMAATCAENDYVHQIAYRIGLNYNLNVEFEAIALKDWENTPELRPEVSKILDSYLNEDTNLVTIQLGDNAHDDFEEDYVTFINYIKSQAPNAKILAIGTFFGGNEKEPFIINAAMQTGAIYVSLDEIKNRPEYQNEMGATVYDADGGAHEINLIDVAVHPNDDGMDYIAKKVVETLETVENFKEIEQK